MARDRRDRLGASCARRVQRDPRARAARAGRRDEHGRRRDHVSEDPVCIPRRAQVPDATVTTWLPFNSSIKDEAGASLFTFFDLHDARSAHRQRGPRVRRRRVRRNEHLPRRVGRHRRRPHAPAPDVGADRNVDVRSTSARSAFRRGAVHHGRNVRRPLRLLRASRGIGVPPSHAHALRYDTEADASFSQPAAWAAFDVDTAGDAGKPPQGFAGAVFDGRYVYFAPYNNGTVARYDTKPPASDGGLPEAGSDAGDAAVLNAWFDTQSHWSAFDTSIASTDRSTSYERRGLFDGRFVYFVSVQLRRAFGAVLTRRTKFQPSEIPSAWSSYACLPDTPLPNRTGSSSRARSTDWAKHIYLVRRITWTHAAGSLQTSYEGDHGIGVHRVRHPRPGSPDLDARHRWFRLRRRRVRRSASSILIPGPTILRGEILRYALFARSKPGSPRRARGRRTTSRRRTRSSRTSSAASSTATTSTSRPRALDGRPLPRRSRPLGLCPIGAGSFF